jgi:hypothetical protein
MVASGSSGRVAVVQAAGMGANLHECVKSRVANAMGMNETVALASSAPEERFSTIQFAFRAA